MTATTVLLLTTDAALADAIQPAVAAAGGCHLHLAKDLDRVRARLLQGGVSLVLAHVPGEIEADQATQILHTVALSPTPAATVVLSEVDDAYLKLRLLRLGAADVLAQPIDTSRLTFLVDILTVRARHNGATQNSTAKTRSGVNGNGNGHRSKRASRLDDFHFATAGMEKLLEQLRTVAPLDATVLLTGETGTGKTHLARVLHRLSPRRDKPFLVVHCGALSETLIESELFGHVRGAFTTADRDRTGKFSEAKDGTLFLDDVDALPLRVQAKLLRAVDDRVFEPVGSNREEALRARLIVASNRSLEKEIEEGRFRQDLYYRLNVVNFHLPPLRDRRDLIRPLAEKFVRGSCSRNCRDCIALTDEAAELLESYDWPGNVRELRNAIEGTVALCPDSRILAVHLPGSIREAGRHRAATVTVDSPRGNALQAASHDAERQRLLDALQRAGNNRTRAAGELGVSRVTLYKKLRRFGLT